MLINFFFFFTLALKSLAPNRGHFRATVRYILTHSDALHPRSTDHLVARRSVRSLEEEKKHWWLLNIICIFISKPMWECQVVRVTHLFPGQQKCLFSPELLWAAVLFVAFGVEALQGLQENQLRFGLSGAARRGGSRSLQVTVFNLGGRRLEKKRKFVL